MEIPAPKPTAAAVLAAASSAKRSLHPGLLLDRFSMPGKQEGQKPVLDAIASARPWSAEDYQAVRNHLEGGHAPDFCAKSKSRLALHLSRAGGLENANTCLHPVFGFAYLPGSGLKGLASAYAGQLWETRRARDGRIAEFGSMTEEQYVQLVEDLFGWAPNAERRGAVVPANPRSGRAEARAQADGEIMASRRGAVVFHDAFAEDPPVLEIDVLTCHYPDYYLSATPAVPGDWQSPRPVTFLTIAADTRFRFRISGADRTLVEAAKRFLLGGLYWLGAGAKTGSGYGHFVADVSPEERQRAQAQALAETAASNLQRLEAVAAGLDPAKQVLWVPKHANSSTGYRISRTAAGTWTWSDGWHFSRNPQPTNTNLVYIADINLQVGAEKKRLLNPRVQVGLTPPPGRP